MSASSLLNAPRSVSLALRCIKNAPLPIHFGEPKWIPELRYTVYRQSLSARDRSMSQLLRTVKMMAASKPTSSLSKQPHILSTERYLGTLAAGLACLPLAREAYPSRTDSRVTPCGIRSLIEFGTLVWALVHPVLYLRRSAHEASPQAISGRTSYHGV